MADWPIRVRNEWITVGQILAEPDRWHDTACYDPLDPSYGGASTAKIYSKQGVPVIASFAHVGGDKPVSYRMMPMPTADASQMPAVAQGLPGLPGVTMPPVMPGVAQSPQKFGLAVGKVELDFVRNDAGSAVWCLANAVTAIRTHGIWEGVLAYNEFTSQVMILRPMPYSDPTGFKPHEMDETDVTRAEVWFNHNSFHRAAEKTVARAMVEVAKMSVIDPVRMYLEDLKWDGVQRLETWLTEYMGVPDSIYTREVGKRTLIGAVARALRPGCKVDTMLILEGMQGTNKSTAINILAGDDFFTDSIPDLKSKDAADSLRGIWIMELGEMAAANRTDMETVKAFLSRREDRYRPAYGKTTITRKRRNIFIGSTNQDNYLKDETGSRRFWPVPVGKIDLDLLRRDRDQLWAEAVELLEAGERWWLDVETEKLATIMQKDRGEDDPWKSKVLEYVDRENITEVSIREILEHGLSLDLGKTDRKESNRVVGILKIAGWKRCGQITAGTNKGAAKYVLGVES